MFYLFTLDKKRYDPPGKTAVAYATEEEAKEDALQAPMPVQPINVMVYVDRLLELERPNLSEKAYYDMYNATHCICPMLILQRMEFSRKFAANEFEVLRRLIRLMIGELS